MINEIILEKLGWTQKRKINVNNLKKYLIGKGYFWSDQVKIFLEQFAFLKMEQMHFDILKTERDIDSSWVLENYSHRLNNIELCIIGQAYDNHMTLFMDSFGKIYGGYDDSLYLIGNSYQSAIENIYYNRELLEL
jgi:SUKH-3 immunity protein